MEKGKLFFHCGELETLLFNKVDKERFNENKKIILPDTFSNMLYYPNESVLQNLKNKKIKKKKLYAIIRNILTGETKDNYGKVYRGLHPAWLLLFVEELEKDGFMFHPKLNLETCKYDGIFGVKHEKIKIRDQINQTFKIYFHLLSNKQINDIFDECDEKLKKMLYLDLIVEKYIDRTTMYQGKYIDMCYVFGNQNTLAIEINELHHKMVNDQERREQIYALSLDDVINFYIENGLESIKMDLYKGLSKCMHKINPEIGTNIYMVKCLDFDVTSSLTFTNINIKLMENKLTLSFIKKKIIDNFGKELKLDFLICKMIKKGDLRKEHFSDDIDPKNLIDYDEEDDTWNLINDTNTRVNRSGLTRILTYPRIKDFGDKQIGKEYSKEICDTFSKFMENFYIMQDQLLSNSFEEVEMIHKQYQKTMSMISSFIGLQNVGLSHFKQFYKSVSNLPHHPILPTLIKCNGRNVMAKDVEKKFGQASKLCDLLAKQTEYNNDMIKNYRWLTDKEIQNIHDKYIELEKQNDDSDSDSESDEELFDFN